jgi:hypothetical protein
MSVDQDWVRENIDSIMNTFCKVHPQFKDTDDVTRMGKSRHKKKILEDMDTMMYRPIYEIAQVKKQKIKAQKLCMEKDKEIKRLESCLSGSKFMFAHDFIVEEFGMKSYEYEKFISSYDETYGVGSSSYLTREG